MKKVIIEIETVTDAFEDDEHGQGDSKKRRELTRILEGLAAHLNSMGHLPVNVRDLNENIVGKITFE